MYRMAGLLSTLPVGMDMEQLLNYYLNIMLMSAFLRQYATNELICNEYVLYNTGWPDSTNDSIINWTC